MGGKVCWTTTSDSDVPAGSIGVIEALKEEGQKCSVKFPKGSWTFTCKSLRPVNLGDRCKCTFSNKNIAAGAVGTITAWTSNETPTCKKKHKLQTLGTSQDNGWACDGRHDPGGCARKCTGFRQSSGWGRYRCATCDYDLCDKCFAKKSVAKANARFPSGNFNFKVTDLRKDGDGGRAAREKSELEKLATIEKARSGTKVYAKYLKNGKWYPAKIVRSCGSRGLDVVFNDGDRWLVSAGDIRHPIGTKMFGAFGGSWYPGKILKVNESGTYDVAFDDGDTKTDMSANALRFSVGTLVCAKYGSSWYPGKVSRVNSSNGNYGIAFNGHGRQRS